MAPLKHQNPSPTVNNTLLGGEELLAPRSYSREAKLFSHCKKFEHYSEVLCKEWSKGEVRRGTVRFVFSKTSLGYCVKAGQRWARMEDGAQRTKAEALRRREVGCELQWTSP